MKSPPPSEIRDVVSATGLTQALIAARLGVSERALRYWLSGQRAMPFSAWALLRQISEAKNN